VYGTAGRIAIGEGMKLGGLDIADAPGARTEGLPTFWERFADATENTRLTRAITDAFRSGKPVEL
jgi:hypothetical protein